MELEEKQKFYWNNAHVRKNIPRGFFYNTTKLRGIFHFLCKYNFDGSRILSVGDGVGFFTYLCGLMWTGCKLMSTDYSETGPEKARELFNIPATSCRCSELPFEDNSYNVVFAIDVLEHVSSYERILFYKEAKRVLTEKSWLIIDIPVTRDYHWEGAQHRIDPFEVTQGITLQGFEVYEYGYYEKNHGRGACLIIARKYSPDNWWLENPSDPGYRVSIDHTNKVVDDGTGS
jgi:SAM-dependent methyltransferase